MSQVNTGANYEISVDGKPRSYRDDPQIAIEAAKYLKSKTPSVEVTVRDLRTNVITPVQWAPADISKPAKGKLS